MHSIMCGILIIFAPLLSYFISFIILKFGILGVLFCFTVWFESGSKYPVSGDGNNLMWKKMKESKERV